MGDKCYMSFTVPKKYENSFFEKMTDIGVSCVFQREGYNGKFVVFGFSDANNALGVCSTSFGYLPKSIPFYGWHSSGCHYSEGVFATDGEYITYCTSVDEVPVIRVYNHTGYIVEDEDDRTCSSKYYNMLDKLRWIVNDYNN